MNRRAAAGVALCLSAAAGACGAPPTPPWHQETGYRWRDLVVPRGDAGLHARCRRARPGIRFENDVSDSLLLGNRILGQGAGVALGDVDGDGLVDVFLAKTRGLQRALPQPRQLEVRGHHQGGGRRRVRPALHAAPRSPTSTATATST